MAKTNTRKWKKNVLSGKRQANKYRALKSIKNPWCYFEVSLKILIKLLLFNKDSNWQNQNWIEYAYWITWQNCLLIDYNDDRKSSVLEVAAALSENVLQVAGWEQKVASSQLRHGQNEVIGVLLERTHPLVSAQKASELGQNEAPCVNPAVFQRPVFLSCSRLQQKSWKQKSTSLGFFNSPKNFAADAFNIRPVIIPVEKCF